MHSSPPSLDTLLLYVRAKSECDARLEGMACEKMTTLSQERRWWTEEEDNVLRQEGELQRAFVELIITWVLSTIALISYHYICAALCL